MELEEMYRQYSPAVYRFALSLCRNAHQAEEITQETFFRVLKHPQSYRGQCDPSTWLCSIAKNCFFDALRRDKRLAEWPEEVEEPFSMEEALLSREGLQRIHRALHALEEPFKEVFTLRMFGELEYRAIGELFGKSENWARVNFYRARQKLQQTLQKEAEK